MKQLQWTWHDYRTDLPQWLTSRIGQIIIEWSVLERELEELIRLLMDVDIRIGRITCHRMNTNTRIAVAANLIQGHVYHNKLPASLFKEFSKLAKEIAEVTQSKRDMIAHGVWDRKKGHWTVLRLAGKRPTPTLRPDLDRLARPVLPQIVPIDLKVLNQIRDEIALRCDDVVAFCQRVGAVLAPLQHKPPEYSRRRKNRQPTNQKVPAPQLRSSRP